MARTNRRREPNEVVNTKRSIKKRAPVEEIEKIQSEDCRR